MLTQGTNDNFLFRAGQGPLFQVADDVIEIGLGVHGEAGVGEVPLTTAHLAVKKLIDHMTDPGFGSYVKKELYS